MKNRSYKWRFASISLGALALIWILARSGFAQLLDVPDEHPPDPGAEIPFFTLTTNAPAIAQSDLPVTNAPSPVFIHRTEAAREAEASLREAFNRLRMDFTDQLFVASKHRTLTIGQTRHPGFQRFVEWFRAQHNDFPLTSELAESWATGTPNDELKEEFAANLRTVMDFYLAASPPDPVVEVKLVSAAATDDFRALDPGALPSFSLPGSNIVSVSEAKRRLLQIFGPTKIRSADYVGRFLRVNCYLLTSAADAVQSADLLTNDLAATMSSIDPLPVDGWKQNLRSAGLGMIAMFRSGMTFIEDLWQSEPTALAALSAVLLFALAGWLLWRPSKLAYATRAMPRDPAYTVVLNSARNETIFLPVKTESNPRLIVENSASSGTLVSVDSETPALSAAPLDLEWEARVLATEKRAEQLLVEVRAGLAPHLAREMMHELVRKLVSDREGLLRAHWRASSEVAELEQRFARVHATLLERLREYQARNLELEKELAATTEENCKLLRTRIEDLQKKIESRRDTDLLRPEEPGYGERG